MCRLNKFSSFNKTIWNNLTFCLFFKPAPLLNSASSPLRQCLKGFWPLLIYNVACTWEQSDTEQQLQEWQDLCKAAVPACQKLLNELTTAPVDSTALYECMILFGSNSDSEPICKTHFLIFTNLVRWGLSMEQSFQMWSMPPLSVTLEETLQVLESKIQSCCFRIQHPESLLPVVKMHIKLKMEEEQNSYKNRTNSNRFSLINLVYFSLNCI